MVRVPNVPRRGALPPGAPRFFRGSTGASENFFEAYIIRIMKDKAQVIISPNITPPPEEHEISAARILAKHFNCRIEFLKPLDGYKRKTANFFMNALEWELKSPIGHAKTTISNNLANAKLQSPNVVFDSRRTKLPDEKIISELESRIKQKRGPYRIVVITKDEKDIEIRKKMC
jgi:hypothetical protein